MYITQINIEPVGLHTHTLNMGHWVAIGKYGCSFFELAGLHSNIPTVILKVFTK